MTATWTCVRVPSTFPPERHPIYVSPVAPMTFNQKAESYPKMARAVPRVLDIHSDDRVVVHTVSYSLAQYLFANMPEEATSRIITYTTATKEKAIEEYRATERAVLMGPGLERGVDFKHDECRAVVVVKVPFPDLQDKQINARLRSRGGERWYATSTTRTLVQATGRGMRSADDYCSSYILDQTFTDNVWKRNKNILPTWWRAGLVFEHQYLGALKS